MAENKENRVTEQEMETAKNTDLPELLTHLGYQVKRIGSYHTTGEMDSLRIKNRRTWFRYSQNVGGDAISFLQHFHNKSFLEAVEYLLAYNGKARDSPAVPLPVTDEPKRESVPFALPPRSQDDRRVFAYLRKRGIAPQVICGFLDSGLLYEDAEHHNCVFVGRDKSGKAVFANKRGTYDLNGSGFKGDIPGSEKTIAFRLPCRPDMNRVYVFEAPIDLMSFCTLHRSMRSNAVALCCLHDGALETYLKEHPHLRRIVLCLDADKWGREAANRMAAKYRERGYAVEDRLPPHGKDWNEALCHRQPCRERG